MNMKWGAEGDDRRIESTKEWDAVAPCISSSVLSIFCQQHHQCLLFPPCPLYPIGLFWVLKRKHSCYKRKDRERERERGWERLISSWRMVYNRLPTACIYRRKKCTHLAAEKISSWIYTIYYTSLLGKEW